MEPVFMVLAQSAAIAAAEAINTGSVQTVDIKKVQALLHENPLLDGSFSEILIDDSELDLSINNDWEVIKTRRIWSHFPEIQSSQRFACPFQPTYGT